MKRTATATLLVLLVLLNCALTGCFEEEKKDKPIKIELVGDEHKIYAGDSTTYVLLISSERDENDTITLSVAGKPSGWDVTVNLTTVTLVEHGKFGFFVWVNSSDDTDHGKHKIKIEGLSQVDNKKYSKTITTRVIAKEDTVVEEGDKVNVDYLGYLGDFVVFDTSIQDIGREDVVAKTDDFQSGKKYEPFKVFVGDEDQDVTDLYTTAVEGFWKAIIGMSEGQSRTVVLAPEEAYGIFENLTLNLTEEVPMVETMTTGEFRTKYPEEALKEGVVSKHYFWRWNITIEYVNETEDVVRIVSEPHINETANPYGWNSEVIYKNQSDNAGKGIILVRHYPEVGQKAIYQGFNAVVSAIEEGQIKLVLNKSSHALGSNILFFDITLVEIVE